MAKWVFDQWDSTMEYPTLGFVAEPGDILDATNAPDARWSLNGDQGAAETVERFAAGGSSDFVETTDGYVLTYDAAQNRYVPTDPADNALLSATYAPGRSVTAHGALGNGVANDTDAINAAIQAGSGGTVYFPAGTYMIDANKSTLSAAGAGILLNVPNTRLVLDPGATIKVIDSVFDSYAAVRVSAADCTIEGGTIEGDLATHPVITGGEWGYCIDVVTGGHRLRVVGTTLRESWGDGIHVNGAVEDLSLIDVTSVRNRRQGASIINAVRPKVIGGTYGQTGVDGYTSPGAGIDLEPEAGMAVLDAVVSGVTLAGNHGPGLVVNSNTTAPVTATITGCRATGNGIGPVAAGGFSVNGPGSRVEMIGCVSDGNTGPGFLQGGTAVNLALTGCRSTGNTSQGYNISGEVLIAACESSRNNGAALLVNDGAKVTATLKSLGDSKVGTNVAIDVYADNTNLTGCLVDATGGTPSFGYAVRGGATGVRLSSCDARGTFTDGAYIDLSGGLAFAFPIPGAAKQTGVAVTAAGVHAALVNLGLITA